eukprot:CAMPEP_0206255618 /NCGR_PEP_ID=MMETSP0047_2-20121206/24339_1 /ASSEMBLY_ACC=CAM_ASM_000192 /TAXON_ID=195065 /ORGANISM="Chroomonas mesostigmatica_cf, Strain CCMP1168" /LENGTH=970 /DNA_ID=CAMNT_0053682021 /DNA_START=9 /DNA_END=2921 /DNA_ORIENTATION=-
MESYRPELSAGGASGTVGAAATELRERQVSPGQFSLAQFTSASHSARARFKKTDCGYPTVSPLYPGREGGTMLRAALLLLAVGCASGQVVYGWQTYCSPGCNSTDIGNQMCDFMCMTADCTYDAADCFGKAQGGYSIRASVYDLVTEYDLLGAPDGRLNSTEFEAYLAQTPVFNDIGVPANMPAFDAPLYDTYDLSGRGGLDAYELALYFTAVLPPAHDMMAPSPSVDWDLWAQDTSLFILAIADTDSSGSLSQAEAASVLRVSSAQFMMVSAGGGDATARSLAMVLGNFGSVLFGDGLMPGVDASGMAGLLVQLFDHTGDMALSLPETLPLGLSPEVFMALDINKNGLVDAVELRDFMEVFSANPCGGYAELVGTEVHVTAQVPLLARTCTWLVNPQWHYDVSIENSNSTLLQVAKDMFGHMPPPPAPNVRRSANRKSSDDGNVLSKREGDMHAHAAARRLQAILPTVRVGGGEMHTRADGTPAVAGEFTFAASVLDIEGVRRCGGALVDELFVLTSASCVAAMGGADSVMQGSVEVVGGTSVGDVAAESFSIVGVHVHPAYDTDHSMDVALLMLNQPSTFHPVELYDGGDVGFDDCHTMHIDALSLSPTLNTLHKKAATAVPQQTCADMYLWTHGTANAIAPDVLCVQGEVSTCETADDLGAPLTTTTPTGRTVLLGVGASVGVCDTLPVPYTRVSEVRQWVLAAGMGMGVHPTHKLHARVEELNLPMGATLDVFAHATSTHNHALSLDSKCQAGASVDDYGSGALVIRYSPGPGGLTALPACDSHCLREFRFRVSVAPVTCAQNFATGDGSPESCTDPMLGGVNSTMGGVSGCTYTPPQSGIPAMCEAPMCPMSVGWPQLGPMEVQGKAYAGGLGHKMVKTPTEEYGVWSCLRDWDAGEQLQCGAKPLELACFWFNEVSRLWAFKGTNGEARLVEQAKYFHGLDVEESRLGPHILIPRPRRESLRAA